MLANSKNIKIFSCIVILLFLVTIGLLWKYDLIFSNKKTIGVKEPTNITTISDNNKDKATADKEKPIEKVSLVNGIDTTKVKYADVPKSRPTKEDMERRERLEATQRYKNGQYGVVVDTSSIRTKSAWNSEVRGQAITVVADATINGNYKSIILFIVVSGDSEGMVLGGYDTDNSPQVINIMRVNGPLSSIAKITIDAMVDNGALDQFSKVKIDNFAYYKLPK
ncbi:hypothetical protein [Veillonella parvula]|uniref:hypothetical protein n=1 Tax=Veillonella parvula TaxID=29466 RepID=UPI00241EDFC0|nr:hypothetical protein [Veillonella parvula]MBS6140778.1 hypothetical protein [Veillonella parvula]